MQDTSSAINIHAAEHDGTSRQAAKDVHKLLGLVTRAQYHVHDNIRCESAEVPRVAGKAFSVANDLFRIGNGGFATMKDAHTMAKLLKFQRDIRTDKSRCANQQNLHLPMP